MDLLRGDDGTVDLADVVHGLKVVGQPTHANLDDFVYIWQLGRPIHPGGVIEVAGRPRPSIQVRIEVDQSQGYVKCTKNWERNTMISTEHDGERLLGQDGANGPSDAVVGLRWHCGPGFDVAHVCPMLALQNHPITVNVVEAFAEITHLIHRRALTEFARAVPRARGVPSTLVEGHADYGNIGLKILKTGYVGRT